MENKIVTILLILEGISGFFFSGTILLAYLCCNVKKEPFCGLDILILNFIISNFGLCCCQVPFAALAGFLDSWPFGDLFCTIFAELGFLTGIGTMISLLMIAVYNYSIISNLHSSFQSTAENGAEMILTLQKKSQEKEDKRLANLMVWSSWLFLVFLTLPPLFGMGVTYGLEPHGTCCTLDYVHHGRNIGFILYFTVLATLGFGIPIIAIIITGTLVQDLLKIIHSRIDARKDNKLDALNRHQGIIKMTNNCAKIAVLCWSPYAFICLYGILFNVNSLHLQLTNVPSVMAKLSTCLNSFIAYQNVPRVKARVNSMCCL